jgi:hypothetical protein
VLKSESYKEVMKKLENGMQFHIFPYEPQRVSKIFESHFETFDGSNLHLH